MAQPATLGQKIKAHLNTWYGGAAILAAVYFGGNALVNKVAPDDTKPKTEVKEVKKPEDKPTPTPTPAKPAPQPRPALDSGSAPLDVRVGRIEVDATTVLEDSGATHENYTIDVADFTLSYDNGLGARGSNVLQFGYNLLARDKNGNGKVNVTHEEKLELEALSRSYVRILNGMAISKRSRGEGRINTADVQRVHQMLDTNGNGVVTRAEMQQASRYFAEGRIPDSISGINEAEETKRDAYHSARDAREVRRAPRRSRTITTSSGRRYTIE